MTMQKLNLSAQLSIVTLNKINNAFSNFRWNQFSIIAGLCEIQGSAYNQCVLIRDRICRFVKVIPSTLQSQPYFRQPIVAINANRALDFSVKTQSFNHGLFRLFDLVKSFQNSHLVPQNANVAVKQTTSELFCQTAFSTLREIGRIFCIILNTFFPWFVHILTKVISFLIISHDLSTSDIDVSNYLYGCLVVVSKAHSSDICMRAYICV